MDKMKDSTTAQAEEKVNEMLYKILLTVILVLLLSACQTNEETNEQEYINEEVLFDDSVITNCVVNEECNFEENKPNSFWDRMFN